MKVFQSSLVIFVLMASMFSVGYGKDSPPKKATLESAVEIHLSNGVVLDAAQQYVIATDKILVSHSIVKPEAGEINAEVVDLPASDRFTVNTYRSLIYQLNREIKKVEPRSRSSDDCS